MFLETNLYDLVKLLFGGEIAILKSATDYPNFTLDAQKTSQEKAKIFAVNQDDRILPVDRNALVVWKFAGEKSLHLLKPKITEAHGCTKEVVQEVRKEKNHFIKSAVFYPE
uniref:Bm13283 n=1 Tax=Brugia malayi TaxID=6279 RepID=A0A0J9XYL8_BRUMA|nr:Bm13283 [Brugia malayi]